MFMVYIVYNYGCIITLQYVFSFPFVVLVEQECLVGGGDQVNHPRQKIANWQLAGSRMVGAWQQRVVLLVHTVALDDALDDDAAAVTASL